jgi:soluble lytic murein transglycosylase-like protein
METQDKIEKAIPVFLGILASLACCALLAFAWPGFKNIFSSAPRFSIEEAAAYDPALFFAQKREAACDPVPELYARKDTQAWVVEYFARVCGSREIARAILARAVEHNIPPALAFALCWEESRFNPRAVNKQNGNGSIDRGLFQLNSNSFPNLETQAFFDPETNIRYGMSHLRHCLDTGKTEIAALAMYNAGTGRVHSTGAPKSTLDYVSRILENRRMIDERFLTQLTDRAVAWKPE